MDEDGCSFTIKSLSAISLGTIGRLQSASVLEKCRSLRRMKREIVQAAREIASEHFENAQYLFRAYSIGRIT